MGEHDESSITLSEVQELITKVTAIATANRWTFGVDFTEDATEIRVLIPNEDAKQPGMPPVEF